MTPLAQNLARIEEAIAQACRKAGRPRAEVELMAVTKTHPASRITEAAALGLRLIGENRVQEFSQKAEELAPQRSAGILQAHLIGHLQSNKAQRAAELFDAVDSVHSARIAERLNAAATALGKKIPILIELKLSPEESKEGLEPDSIDAALLFEKLPHLSSLEVRGLMTIAPFGVPDEETRACFRSLREWRDRLAQAYPRMDLSVLSMGMSGDFAMAIEEGSTRVRIGSALFGDRHYPWSPA